MNIDYVYSVPHIILPGETLSSTERNIFTGGKGLNQSVAMAKAGLNVYHAGKTGNDGGILLDALKENGVNTDFVRVENTQSGHTIIQVDENGQNSIILFKGTNYMMTEDFVDEVLSAFGEGDVLVLQNEINLLGMIINKAYDRKMTIVLNPSPFEDKLLGYSLDKISIFMVNEIEGSQISGIPSDSPEEILDWFSDRYPNAEVVLTLGSRGAWYSGRGERVFRPAFKVKAVDTTSAGDTFSGYFIAGRARGYDAAKTMELAAKAAAITVSRPGAAPSIPTAAEVMD